ncbi:hypothetical protein EV204_1263 [Tissierella praeacuta]|nr:hypothetical protein EV204_1263 [Tissierella praeacuta]
MDYINFVFLILIILIIYIVLIKIWMEFANFIGEKLRYFFCMVIKNISRFFTK